MSSPLLETSEEQLHGRAASASFGQFRMGHAFSNANGAHARLAKRLEAQLDPLNLLRRDSSNCTSGGLYRAPLTGDSVPSSNQTSFQWDTSCLAQGVSKIDIYLYAPLTPTTNNLPIHAWKQIPADQGSYQVKLAPKWWNATTSIALNLNIVPSGNEPWDSNNPIGPTWTATYDPPPPGQSPPADAVPGGSDDSLISIFYSGGSLTKGGMAAAIICPLVVLGVVLGLWIRKLHINRNNKTADWAEHMDQRMSRISLDWTTGGDGSAGPVPGSRPASFMRPASTYFPRPSMGAETSAGHGSNMQNIAGRGAGGFEATTPEMAEALGTAMPRTRARATSSAADRQSRISFAHETLGDRVSRTSFAPSSAEAHAIQRGHKSSASLPRLGTNGTRRSAYTDSYHDPNAPAMPKLSSQWRNTRDSRFSGADGAGTSGGDDIDDAGDEDPYAGADMDGGAVEETEDLTVLSPVQNQGARPLGAGVIDAQTVRNSLDAASRLTATSPAPASRSNQSHEDESDRAFRNSVLKYPALTMVTTKESDGTGMFANDADEMATASASGGGNGAAQPALRPISGVSDGGESAYAPTEQARLSEYIQQPPFTTTAGAHAISPEHPARKAAAAAARAEVEAQRSGGAPASAAGGATTGMAPPANASSPDDALRQYAALRSAGGGAGSSRTLYTPDVSPAPPSTAALAKGAGTAVRRGSSIYVDAPASLGIGHRPQQGSINTAGSSILSDDVVGYNETSWAAK